MRPHCAVEYHRQGGCLSVQYIGVDRRALEDSVRRFVWVRVRVKLGWMFVWRMVRVSI